MEELEGALSSMDASVILWIAGGVALLFIAIVVFDSIRKKRADSSGRSRNGREERPQPGFFKSLPLLYKQLRKEMARRRRHRDRERDREL